MARHGGFRRGDELVEINGLNVQTKSLVAVEELLNEPVTEVMLVVARRSRLAQDGARCQLVGLLHERSDVINLQRGNRHGDLGEVKSLASRSRSNRSLQKDLFERDVADPDFNLAAHLVDVRELCRREGWGAFPIGLSFEKISVQAEITDSAAIPTVWSALVGACNRPAKIRRPILTNVSGYCKPGELLLVLGPPGSGCSTLLRAVAGRLSSNCTLNGKLLFNGSPNSQDVRSSIKLVEANDTHIPSYTVAQTLELPANLCTPGEMPYRSEIVRMVVPNILHILGLSRFGSLFVILQQRSCARLGGNKKIKAIALPTERGIIGSRRKKC